MGFWLPSANSFQFPEIAAFHSEAAVTLGRTKTLALGLEVGGVSVAARLIFFWYWVEPSAQELTVRRISIMDAVGPILEAVMMASWRKVIVTWAVWGLQ